MALPRPAVIFILGPTAIGKSRVAQSVAKSVGGEIVNADSVQIYRGLDKGTAKPAPEVRREIPHHLIDITDAAENYSAALYANRAKSVIADILRRKKIAVVTGGTMFYARALLEGLADLPPAQPKIREKYLKLAEELGWPRLHERLSQLDEHSAQRIPAGDKQRILRALEVIDCTGQSFSTLLKDKHRHGGLKKILGERGIPLRVYGILPGERSVLHERIARRFAGFLDSGLVEEVQTLQKRGDLSLQNSSVRSVGYRQVWQHLEEKGERERERKGEGKAEFDYEEMIAKAVAATRQLAKRQLTWLRNWEEITRLDASVAEATITEDVLLRLDAAKPAKY